MIDFLVSLPTYGQDKSTQMVWGWIEKRFTKDEGVCYYKHPVVVTTTGVMPELALFTRSTQPLAIRCLPYQLEEIKDLNESTWAIGNESFDSPILEMEDFIVGLQSKFDKDRTLRHRLKPQAILALPLISKSEFENRFGEILKNAHVIWAGGEIQHLNFPLKPLLSEIEWKITRAISQGVTPLKNFSNVIPTKTTTLGETIKSLDRQIALLDEEQAKVALQISPGPQRIRGMAGTGKTVLLAMKAANIHLRFPDKKILFTFNTQSLYNQTKTLISKFYRFYSDTDPDWDQLHIRHGWGGRNRQGVYYDLCGRQGVVPLNLNDVKGQKTPFQVCCKSALRLPIQPEYDFVLVDEAQDFPKEFFEILFKLSQAPHQIYWAYDELQNLFSVEIPRTEELFGKDDQGKPNVTLEGDDYPGNIEKDFVLHRSYRCPQPVLMLAHAIGLGLYSQKNPVQMLEKKESWNAIGYEVEQGNLQKDEDIVIYRPPENSPSPISQIYKGDQSLVTALVFNTREEELNWIASSIQKDIRKEGVAPEQIVVISLDASRRKNYLPLLQVRLVEYGIASTIPGLIDDTATFAEPGKVTLCNVFRAKGNEAYIVYILSFESLYDFVSEIESRNMAFTSISRSKAWVRVTGVGKMMEDAKKEIDGILNDQPRFKFTFPDIEAIRRLDAETPKRRRAITKAKDSAAELLRTDPEALAALALSDPDLFNKLVKRINEARRENQ